MAKVATFYIQVPMATAAASRFSIGQYMQPAMENRGRFLTSHGDGCRLEVWMEEGVAK